MSADLVLSGLPPLGWTGVDSVARVADGGSVLELDSAAGVDWTNSATGHGRQHGASALAFDAPGERFSLTARVSVPGERSTFDAGALAIWWGENRWAKLCNEYSPDGDAMVVSVVTNDWSDDANGVLLDGREVWLRISALGPVTGTDGVVGGAWAFHASFDGERFEFVRQFRMDAPTGGARVGFLAQAPLGDQATARFDRIRLDDVPPADMRDGS